MEENPKITIDYGNQQLKINFLEFRNKDVFLDF